MLENIVSKVNDIVWNPGLVGLLILAGLYFSFRTRFVQIRKFGSMLRSLFSRKAGNNGISSFEAFCLALSGRVGTGNIVGVATAIAFGGPGAVFWMWVVAFFGASTAFVESTLAQIYKFSHSTGFRGGPASFIENGLKMPWLGKTFAVITLVACGVFLPTVQSNGASTALSNAFSVSTLASGIGMAALLGLVVFGGVRRIARVAAIVTPFMALGYMIMAIVVICINIQAVPGIFASIFTNAFGINPVCGGIIGSTIAMGVKRGIFSNEAGQGTGAIVSASADVAHPAQQGLAQAFSVYVDTLLVWASADVAHPAQQGLAQAFSVYVDTLLVCTATALMILSSGMYNIFDSTGQMIFAGAPELANNYVSYTQTAVDSVFKGFGGRFVSIAMVFFVFSTVMAYYFYSESSIIYLFRKGKPKWESIAVNILRVITMAAVIFGAVRETDVVWQLGDIGVGLMFGAVRETDVVWQLGDIGVGLMAWVTVISVLILCPAAIRSLKDYETTH